MVRIYISLFVFFVCNLCDKNLLIDKPCDKLVIVLLIALCKYWDKVVALLSFLQGQLAVDYDILMGTKLTKVQKISMMIGCTKYENIGVFVDFKFQKPKILYLQFFNFLQYIVKVVKHKDKIGRIS